MSKNKWLLFILALGFTLVVFPIISRSLIDKRLEEKVKKSEQLTHKKTVKIYDSESKRILEKPKIVKTDEDWKRVLTKKQFEIIRQKGTETPFTGEYNEHYKKGIYRCVGCGTDLFLSDGKFPVVGPGAYNRKWYAEVTMVDGRIYKVT